MNIKEEIIAGIKNKTVVNDIPMMYRGNLDTDAKVSSHFNLGDPEKGWKKILNSLDADIMTNGHTLSRWFTYFPEYRKEAPYNGLYEDPILLYSWGIDHRLVKNGSREYIDFGINSPLRDASIEEIIKYRGPEIDDFNYENFSFDMHEKKGRRPHIMDYMKIQYYCIHGE